MTQPVQQAQTPARPLARNAPTAPDRESADQFRAALERGTKPVTAEPTPKSPPKQGRKQAALATDAGALPPPTLPPTFNLPEKPVQEQPRKPVETASSATPGPQAPAADTAPAALPVQALDAPDLAPLFARLDAGMAPSVTSQLHLPGGTEWRANQVVIDQGQGGLSVSIDLRQDGGDPSEALAELRARLRARGIAADSRIAEPDSRIA